MPQTSESVDDAINIITDVLLSISIVCCILTLLSFLIFTELRTYPIRLIMYQCIAIIFSFLFFMISFADAVVDSSFCEGCAAITHFFFIADFCWCGVVAFNFYQMVVKRNKEVQRYEKFYHAFAWGIPLLCFIGVIAADDYGVIGDEFCWITSEGARFGAFFIPGLIILHVNIIFFFFVAREIHETLSESKSEQKKSSAELRVYLSILVSVGCSWLFGFLMYVIPNDTAATVFLFFFTFTTPLQGAFIFLAYVANKRVLGRWAGLFSCIPCCARIHEEWSQTQSTSGSSRTGSGGSSSSGGRSGSSSSSSA
mmetsp:Transcript_20084/g.27689  ORF Transcript_20084/g.27689 Transcript_20084/m.27689 type:complete len:311 (+) Transcript_20084:118-1050(+)|eukprot:CAMPEP_0201479242 /NCGR_PEP_ID=MMETSP0151_2-20130828/3948_1 /ASSEMBLY_ACC=CAM_ASM_000257 /TAXON_ID=200890 /ORGANISM="Paramoeba atlantica, Strain 621/1 / CCAP 1560/9" /LENGTH=310 /DNA_ID=CAMNT_0047860623 /DNA_START=119 /DNA_END=1051 /DNA_ORIENTATION=-